jgi:hypothetical protein
MLAKYVAFSERQGTGFVMEFKEYQKECLADV